MVIEYSKFLFLLGLWWMSKVGVTLGQSRDCTAEGPPSFENHRPGLYGSSVTYHGVPGWRCNSGQCVEGEVCNGLLECSDGSDESPVICCASTCPSDPDICVPSGQKIEPDQDCRDCTHYISDYRNYYSFDGEPGWRCNSGQCLAKTWVCNGSPQCSDGSDESTTTCCASTCPSDPDICIQAGQEIKPGQDCRNCTTRNPFNVDVKSIQILPKRNLVHHANIEYGDPSWRCNSGQCVDKLNVCDGYPHCSDGSDESPTICCASTCPSDPDICIPAGQEIKPGQDCRDCTNRDGYRGWRCNSGYCLEKIAVCDGYPHCSDGEDESPSGCCASTCPSDSHICIPAGKDIVSGQDCRDCTDLDGMPGWRCNSGQCLEKRNVCDGSSQCPDGSDESPAACCASTCPSDPDIYIPAGQEIQPGQDCRDCWGDTDGRSGWRCNSGQCVQKRKVCDGSPQCPDGSDESNAICCASTCPSDPDICIPDGQKIQPGQDCRDCWWDRDGRSGWRCNSGQCVQKWKFCDGISHCLDGSDESPATCCASTCPSDPDICIPAGQEIKPGQDCRNCTHSWDGPGWRCNSGQCVYKRDVCDGSRQCSDGSDESTTICCASTCPSDTDICVPAGQEIKPGQDCRYCADISDRYNDGGPGWRCNNGQCVEKKDVCDGGYSRCSDGSDQSPNMCCASTCPSDPDICIQAGQEILPDQDCRDCNDSDGYPGWRCNSGQCLEKTQVCDGEPQCPDGSDELSKVKLFNFFCKFG